MATLTKLLHLRSTPRALRRHPRVERPQPPPVGVGLCVGRACVAQGGLLGRGEVAQLDVLAAALHVSLERAGREGREGRESRTDRGSESDACGGCVGCAGFRGCGCLAWNGRVLERFVILTPRYPAALADVFSDSPSALAAASAPVANAVISS
eukprot:scaffold129733_cov69-Phaeocystis_antarctica.AAC.12